MEFPQRERARATAIKLGCQANAWPIDPNDANSLEASLADMRALGFAGFETGFRNVLNLEKNTADWKGLALFGVHIFLPDYDPVTRVAPLELAQRVGKTAAVLGAEYLILSGATPPAENRTDAAKSKAEGLNMIAGEVKGLGLKLAYHNHGAELSGSNAEIETLFCETDASLVSFLLDAGHAFRAGIKLVEFIELHSGRLSGIHLRDFQEGRQVPLGEGDFPLEGVAAVLERKQWAGWIVAEEEREDGSKPGMEAVSCARDALRRAFGI